MLKGLIVMAGVVIGAAVAAPQVLPSLIHGAAPKATLKVAAAPVAASSGSVTLRAGSDGHFRTEATILGQRVLMLVDTGATVVALSYEQGQALGLVNGSDRFDLTVSTANGAVGAKRVVLNAVRVASITVPAVTAVVMARGAMDGNLLGMSFLGRLSRMEASRDKLTLER